MVAGGTMATTTAPDMFVGGMDDMMSEASASEFFAFAVDEHDDTAENETTELPEETTQLNTTNVTNTAIEAAHPPPLPPLLPPKLAKGKEKAVRASSGRSGKLTLLELPIDILRLIVQEITLTNDLTSLALTNSTFHSLAVPHIYARFDIVWPDAHLTASDTKSVDALTYGLSTLCLGSSFAKRTRRLRNPDPSFNRRGDYASYTRKFSLGNGPSDWVTDYLIGKESGKMLGTLVAIAVEKMVNLETFVWDMPTGVLSDIFLALGSLQDRAPNTGDCKLERVWIRWHDNSEPLTTPTSSSPAPVPPPPAVIPTGSILSPIGILLPSGSNHPPPGPPLSYSQSRVEYPTFSVLPPLRSLSVLEIDELAYLDEMSMLIERSQLRLRELRVGISKKASDQSFVQIWDGRELQQVDMKAKWPGESTIGDRRLGGVLGILVGRVYDIRRKSSSKSKAKKNTETRATTTAGSSSDQASSSEAGRPASQEVQGTTSQGSASSGQDNGDQSASQTQSQSSLTVKTGDVGGISREDASQAPPKRLRLDGKLKLHTLELERVPLSMHVCAKAIDWTTLTTLTLLGCPYHENLWKMLRKQFMPTSSASGMRGSSGYKSLSGSAPQYHLALKNIHTDLTSPALISFLKDALAPNTLEVLFLQDHRRTVPLPVSIEQIFKGPVRRHRTSLRKLLLDSSDKSGRVGGSSDNVRWRMWMLTTEMVMYLTNGKMNNLKELAVTIYYKDWHTFLQRLPNVPQLRSLYLPFIGDHSNSSFEPKELALQIVDIVTLRPEMQLCYVGISNKCFEILETRPPERTRNRNAASPTVANQDAAVDSSSDAEDEDEDHSHAEDTSDDDSDEETPTSVMDMDETQSEVSAGLDSDSDSLADADLGSPHMHFRLREILFYDDKVAIFKARHGRL